jgi:hypothetical protein
MPKEEFECLVRNSSTLTEIIQHFGYKNAGGGYRMVMKRIEVDGIDSKHIPKGLAANKGRSFYSRKFTPIKNVLIKDAECSGKVLRGAILRNKLLPYECVICGQGPIWREEPLTLILDHINGINNDNRLGNLRFLCPNCNIQTPTYGSKNFDKKQCFCDKCGKPRNRGSKSGLCLGCFTRIRETPARIAKEELEKLVWEMPTTQIAAEFGVSDKAVAKWCRKYEIEKPGPGYWAKLRSNIQG